MPEPMTEAEARERLVDLNMNAGTWGRATDAILATTDALAVLLDWHEMGKRATPEQLTALLRGAEEAGRAKHFPIVFDGRGLLRADDLWRIVPDEEGAAGGAREPADDDACDCGEDTVMGCALRPSRHCGNTWPDEEGASDG